MRPRFPRLASLRDAAAFRSKLADLGAELPCDDRIESAPGSPLASPLELGDGPNGPIRLRNRFCVQPMEGWDGTGDGRPGPMTERRWQRFGASGAAWVWGCEAVAVSRGARANPNQLLLDEETAPALGRLRAKLVEAARATSGETPLVGLQLTHSGRWSVPERGRRRPRVAYRHPLLDPRAGVTDDGPVLSDDEVEGVIDDFGRAASLAEREGFEFVDLKHCHGYLMHEFLSARSREGRYGGSTLEDRTVLVRRLVGAVREAAPRLRIGVRLSLFDGLPFRSTHDTETDVAEGRPEPHPLPYHGGFGLDPERPDRIDLAEPIALVRALVDLGVTWINATAASPYYTPHLQRPALYPPSDGYPPPEDPLLGVTRLLHTARDLKAAVPEAVVVSSGWSYLQEFLPLVAQACVRAGWFDAVGLGRLVLSYPELPLHVLGGRDLERKRLCRTFSDCTTAPRNGLVSGCYPLDPEYRRRPEYRSLQTIKRGAEATDA